MLDISLFYAIIKFCRVNYGFAFRFVVGRVEFYNSLHELISFKIVIALMKFYRDGDFKLDCVVLMRDDMFQIVVFVLFFFL